MPAQQGVGSDEAVVSAVLGEEPGQGCEDCPVWPAGARPGDLATWRRSTATSWRSTSSSAFLEVCPRARSASQPRSRHKLR